MEAPISDSLDSREAVAFSARDSLRYMLSELQAGQLMAPVERSAGEARPRRAEQRRELAQRHGSRVVGGTGLLVADYVDVCARADQADTMAHADPEISQVETAQVLRRLGVHREASIRAAMRDRFHWRLVARPAELLDLDSLMLMWFLLDAGHDEELMASWLGWRRGDVLAAPLDIAEQLRLLWLLKL